MDSKNNLALEHAVEGKVIYLLALIIVIQFGYPITAYGTTALVVVFSSLSGFLGHASVGGLDPVLLGIGAVAAAGGSLVGSYLVRTRVPSAALKPLMGILLWVIALKMLWDVVA